MQKQRIELVAYALLWRRAISLLSRACGSSMRFAGAANQEGGAMNEHSRRFSRRVSKAFAISLAAATLCTIGESSASTFTFATGSNTSLATSQPISLSPDLVIHQARPNFSLATAQPVSPQFYAYDVFGNVSNARPSEFFSMGLQDNAHLSMQVGSTNVSNQTTELLLYDANKNLVAIAAGNVDGFSSRIDFTVPVGGNGAWTAQVTNGPSGPSIFDFDYDLRFFSPFTYITEVLGNLLDPTANSDSAFYAISANDGDHLSLRVDANDPATQFPELLLYDQNRNLVAIANGNALNGSSSVIDFTIPSGATGVWYAQVTGSPSHVSPAFAYDLQIQGATGFGPIDPLARPAAVGEPSPLVLLLGALASAAAIRRRGSIAVRAAKT